MATRTSGRTGGADFEPGRRWGQSADHRRHRGTPERGDAPAISPPDARARVPGDPPGARLKGSVRAGQARERLPKRVGGGSHWSLGVSPGRVFDRELIGLDLPVSPHPAITGGYRAAIASRFAVRVRPILDPLEPRVVSSAQGVGPGAKTFAAGKQVIDVVLGQVASPRSPMQDVKRGIPLSERSWQRKEMTEPTRGAPDPTSEKPVPTENRVPPVRATNSTPSLPFSRPAPSRCSRNCVPASRRVSDQPRSGCDSGGRTIHGPREGRAPLANRKKILERCSVKSNARYAFGSSRSVG